MIYPETINKYGVVRTKTPCDGILQTPCSEAVGMTVRHDSRVRIEAGGVGQENKARLDIA